MSKKLAAKAGLIQLPPAAPAPAAPSDERRDVPRPKTAPGSMLAFMSQQSASVREAEELRSRLEQFDGASPVRRLDARTVRPSRWANRHADSFQGEDFDALKAEIAAAGGNVQPIKVRRLQGDGGYAFEVVFGHRRHRACLELGLPVAALVEDVSDQTLFVEMERENRLRKDLSAWEQGQMYERALSEGLYPSQGKLAQAIGRDLGDVGKALKLARLPLVVIEAFRSPLDLQFRWAKPLSDAQQADPEGLIARAKAVKAERDQLSPREVFSRLVGPGSGSATADAPRVDTISVRGRPAGSVSFDTRGKVVVTVDGAGDWDDGRRKALVKLLEDFLAR